MKAYFTFDCTECNKARQQLYEKILALTDTDYLSRTHFFEGRYENIYVDRSTLPGIDVILDTAMQQGARQLGIDPVNLRLGFWLNIMWPGHTTTRHTHDDDDELLSGVYYLSVPEKSGQLLLWHDSQEITVQPVEGRFVFFSPQLPHAVTRHEGRGVRISIAFNIGPRDEE